MASHSSVLAWRIPGTGEPGGLPSLGSHRVGHDLSDLAVYVLIKFGYKASVPNEISFSHFFNEKIYNSCTAAAAAAKLLQSCRLSGNP